MGKTNRGTGTWSEVVYILRQQAEFCRRRAGLTRDREIASFLTTHAAICARIADLLRQQLAKTRVTS